MFDRIIFVCYRKYDVILLLWNLSIPAFVDLRSTCIANMEEIMRLFTFSDGLKQDEGVETNKESFQRFAGDVILWIYMIQGRRRLDIEQLA